jgi:hypothetical protein
VVCAAEVVEFSQRSEFSSRIGGRAARCRPSQFMTPYFERSDVFANHFYDVSSAPVKNSSSGIQSHADNRF